MSFWSKPTLVAAALALTAVSLSAEPNVRALGDLCQSGKQGACRKLAKIAEHNRDPNTRAAAVSYLTDKALLARIAVKDPDARVRGRAVVFLDDQALLTKIAKFDEDVNVRAYAASKLASQSPAKTADGANVFPTVIHANQFRNDPEAGTAVLRIISDDPDSSFAFDISGHKIVDGNRYLSPPIRCLLASGERHTISLEASKSYKLKSGYGRYQMEAKSDSFTLDFVPAKDKDYTLNISISLTEPTVTSRLGEPEVYYSRGRAGTIRAQVTQDDDRSVAARKEGPMYY